MSADGSIRHSLERLRSAPGDELGRWARIARFQLHLWRFCARRLWENNLAAMSAALSFRTIFALIPSLVLAILVLKSLGALEDGKQNLRTFLSGSGFDQISVVEKPDEAAEEVVTAESKTINVADEIERIVGEVEAKLTFRRVGPVGIVLLIWTALTLISTAERSLNRIFGAERPRPLGRRLLLYWSVLTLGPLVSIAAAYVGKLLVDGAERIPGVSWLLATVGWIAPVLVGVLVLATVYRLLPNAHVRRRAALGGALISVPLWLLAKWGFSVYVTSVVGSRSLYGALGLLPLFLLWVNLSWTIFLFGAQVAQTAVNLTTLEIEERAQLRQSGPSDLLATAMAVAQPYQSGAGPVHIDEIVSRTRLPGEYVRPLLEQLAVSNVVCPVEGDPADSYVLARPARLIQILEIVGIHQPPAESSEPEAADGELAAAVRTTWTKARTTLGDFTLADAVSAMKDGRPT